MKLEETWPDTRGTVTADAKNLLPSEIKSLTYIRMLQTLLVNKVPHTQHTPPPVCEGPHAECAEQGWGLWDWLPEARSWTGLLQLCCSTQLEHPYAASLSCWVATPPTHTGGSSVCVCFCVRALVLLPPLLPLTTQRVRKTEFLCCSSSIFRGCENWRLAGS